MSWQRFIKFTGIFLILAFSTSSMFLSFLVREIDGDDQPQLKSTLAFTSSFEDQFYDYRMKKTLDQKAAFPNIILGKVDDESLKVIGRWPWKRETWAKVLNKLKGYGAKTIAFDVIFSEPELVCGLRSGDDALKESIIDFQSIPGNKIILAYSNLTYFNESEAYKELPEDLYNFILDTKQEEGFNLKQYWVQSTTYPIKKLLETEAGLGYISNQSDSDGVFRYYPLVNNIDSLYFPSIGLLSFTSHTGAEVKLEIAANGNSVFKVNNHPIHLNINGEAKIRWMGDEQNFPAVSLHRILNAPANDPELTKTLKGRMIFIGSTAVGAHDLRNTPINPKLPGVYSHMNMANMLEKANFYKPSDDSLTKSLVILSIGLL
ncbi:CHASE2 domain-containing protein, partial [Bacteriovoracaceae bacterium]|nr:CHASE2 domain-containing protein [Bacteriovoracaceae bacterium]